MVKKVEDVDQLVECSPNIHGALGLVSPNKSGVVMHICKPREIKAGESGSSRSSSAT